MEKGKVVELKAQNIAVVELTYSDNCKKCCACAVSKNGKMLLEVSNDIDAKVGDHVKISILSGDLILKASLLLYFLPLIAFITGAIIVTKIMTLFNFSNQLSSISGFLMGVLLLGVTIIAGAKQARGNKHQFKIKITEIIQ